MNYNERFKAGKFDTRRFDREFEMTQWLNENSESVELQSVYTTLKYTHSVSPYFHIIFKRIIGTDGLTEKKKVMI